MKTVILAAGLALMASGVQAKTLERACLSSDRSAANRTLCGCIQDVANLVLEQSDQRRAATFFTDPHKAQETRQSDANRDEKFWLRYKAFGSHSEKYCG